MSIQTSNESLASGAAQLLQLIQAAIRDLESRAAIAPRLATLPPFEDDPPPLLLPALALIRSAHAALSFRWLSGLPAWAVPIAWGLILAILPVAILVRLVGPGGLGTNLFLFAHPDCKLCGYQANGRAPSRLTGSLCQSPNRFRRASASWSQKPPTGELPAC